MFTHNTIDLPDPTLYGVSPIIGFLPESPPLTRLPSYYDKWEGIIQNLPSLILYRRLRHILDQLPLFSTSFLCDIAEWRRAYHILSLFAHGYIWGDKTPAERLPRSVSVPLLEVATHVQLPPVASYAALCLWNYKPRSPEIPYDLDNLETLSTFTGTPDESWFYMVSVAIEAHGAPSIPLMLDAMRAAYNDDISTVIKHLHKFAECLSNLTCLLERVHEKCHPHAFYHQIRPFLAGSRNMAHAGLPRGVAYEYADGHVEYHQYAGGSNAQSSLIQFFDIVLGVKHQPFGESSKSMAPSSLTTVPEKKTFVSSPGPSFIYEMRKYMPGNHARFLQHLEKVANIRGYVQARKHQRELCQAFDTCVKNLSAFRDKHISIATRYIVIPSHKPRASPNTSEVINIAQPMPYSPAGKACPPQISALTGTGGTALIPFLKQARDETEDALVD